MFGVFAQLERGMIAARMRAGRRLKAASGGYAGYGSPPFGFRSEDGELVPDDDEQRTLTRIAELHAQGASLRSIGRILTEEGYSPKRSATWHPQTLSGIVDGLPRVPWSRIIGFCAAVR
jgi:DNA invertase Pin-like site-specific DNA recombinase